MLFSNDLVANFINASFEPAWEMVRPVPTIRIDFGNDTVVTRTLHGNIATYVCTPGGQVLDVLPGIYSPGAYLQCLDQFRKLAVYTQAGRRIPPGDGDRLKHYHEQSALALSKKEPPPVLVDTAGMTKAVIERPMLVLMSGKEAAQVPFPERRALRKAGADPESLRLKSPEELADWKLLAEDTKQNEAVRRRQIHEMLAAAGSVRPEQVTKKLYKEVLHADLDDPYLGLGEMLFSKYPFAGEDRQP